MNEDIYEIYEGQEPYLFISYSHQDSEQVEPMIHGLRDMGYRLWYDTGIAVGSRWPDTIAEHLMESNCVVAFISENAVASDYCQEELFFAMELRKPIVAVYIADTMLPPGLRMRLSARQAIYRYKFGNDSDFLKKLDKERVVSPCKEEKKSTLLTNDIISIFEELSDDTQPPLTQHTNTNQSSDPPSNLLSKSKKLNTLLKNYRNCKSPVSPETLKIVGDAIIDRGRFSFRDLAKILGSTSLASQSIFTMLEIGMIQQDLGSNTYMVDVNKSTWQAFSATL